jgi:prepilin-type processing-associated H-X9-DG protein
MSSVENRPTLNMQKPCSNCYIVAIGANLLYADGRVANINEGGWLHHVSILGVMEVIYS